MRTVFIYVAIIVGILSIPFASQAEEKHGRFFAGAGVAYVGEDFDDGDLKKIFGNSSIDDSWGINVFGGYWWIKHLAVEGNFNWYADFDGEAGDIDFDISIWTVMLDLKVFSPALWEDRIFPYVRIGGGYMMGEIDSDNRNLDESDFAYNIGLGCDVFVKDRISVGLDGKRVWGTGDVSEFNHYMVTLRAAYHF
jgi:opacity protein-like surface antigen